MISGGFMTAVVYWGELWWEGEEGVVCGSGEGGGRWRVCAEGCACIVEVNGNLLPH
jgi:hypothetical protein